MTYTYKASIVIVNYNGKRYLEKLFASLEKLNTDKTDFEVVFEDNNSTDDSIEYLEGLLKDSELNVKYVRSKENLGFAGGNNLGADHAAGEYIVLLNNDTVVDPEWLNELISFIDKDESIGIVNSKLLFFYDFIRFEFNTVKGFTISDTVKINEHAYTLDRRFSDFIVYNDKKKTALCMNNGTLFIPMLDGVCDYHIEFDVLGKTEKYDYISLDFDLTPAHPGKVDFNITVNDLTVLKETLVQNAGSKINEFNDGEDIGFKKNDGEAYARSYEIDSACGAAMIIRKKDFDDLGGFDDRYFMYYEDSDLSYRMKESGKKLYYCPTSIVRHYHAGSSGEWSKFFTYHVLRNRLVFIARHKSRDVFKKEYTRLIYSAIRQKRFVWTRIRAARDAKKLINGSETISF